MKITLSTILGRIFIALSAFLFALFPSFIHQYQHQLIGHVHELRRQVDSMCYLASKSGKNLDQYIKKFIDQADQDFSNQGKAMKRTLTRWNTLSSSLARLQKASILTRPFIFFFYLQWDIFKSTAVNFQTEIPFNLEGLFYACLGVLNGYGLFHLAMFLWKKISLKKAKHNPS